MNRIQKVNRSNKDFVISCLKKNIVMNAFTLYDLQYDEAFTEMYFSVGDDSIESYILIYKRLKYPSVFIEGKVARVKDLLEQIHFSKMIMHVPPEFLPHIKQEYPHANTYKEEWMLIQRNHLSLVEKGNVRKLELKDESKLASLLPERLHQEDFAEVLQHFSVYGAFVKNKLVSTARSLIQLPEIWVIGGIYTHPKYRNQGFGTQTTHAITKKGLEKARFVSLFVRSDNYSALRVYEKIGYEKIGNKIWVDIRTGMKP